ncbi:hypothetical protein [Gordonia bronchialis]|uniref:hypothetical protein n=1 Tax=Gordonia bronchialis TaxID=2054 RepID=UPI00242DAA44|nr:hypothetical protein [Gordonia bronchialis]
MASRNSELIHCVASCVPAQLRHFCGVAHGKLDGLRLVGSDRLPGDDVGVDGVVKDCPQVGEQITQDNGPLIGWRFFPDPEFVFGPHDGVVKRVVTLCDGEGVGVFVAEFLDQPV